MVKFVERDNCNNSIFVTLHKYRCFAPFYNPLYNFYCV